MVLLSGVPESVFFLVSERDFKLREKGQLAGTFVVPQP